jgi:hypothetical protein
MGHFSWLPPRYSDSNRRSSGAMSGRGQLLRIMAKSVSDVYVISSILPIHRTVKHLFG